jgi:hypothetical protein
LKPVKLPPQGLARNAELEAQLRRSEAEIARLRRLLTTAAHAAADLLEQREPLWRGLLAWWRAR